MKKIIGASVIMVMSVIVISGCMAPAEKQSAIESPQENSMDTETAETATSVESVEEEMVTGDTDVIMGDDIITSEKDNSDKSDDMSLSQADADECIAGGGIYNAMMGECFENGGESSGGDEKLEIDDDDSDIDRAAKECINDGGLFNSQLQECFK